MQLQDEHQPTYEDPVPLNDGRLHLLSLEQTQLISLPLNYWFDVPGVKLLAVLRR